MQLTSARLLATIMMIMKVSKYLCSTMLNIQQRYAHHLFPKLVLSRALQQAERLVQQFGQHSSGYRTNTMFTSFISGPSVVSMGLSRLPASDSDIWLPSRLSVVGVLLSFISVEGVLLSWDSSDSDFLSLYMDPEVILAGRVGASES